MESRIANAKLEATFFLADVEIVTANKLLNMNRPSSKPCFTESLNQPASTSRLWTGSEILLSPGNGFCCRYS